MITIIFHIGFGLEKLVFVLSIGDGCFIHTDIKNDSSDFVDNSTSFVEILIRNVTKLIWNC